MHRRKFLLLLLLACGFAHGQITLISSSAGDTGNGNNTNPLVLTLGTHAANDVAIVFAGGTTGSAPVDITANAEYTEQAELIEIPGIDRQANLFYRVLTSGSDTSPTLSKSVSARLAGAVMVFRGVDVSSPPSSIFDVAVQTLADSDNYTANPPITPTTDNGALILFDYIAASGANKTLVVGIPDTPAGMTEGPSNIPGYNYSDVQTAYDVDYETATTFTPSIWLSLLESKFQDAQTQVKYDDSPADDEGVFNGGIDYLQNDTITMTGGATVNADTVDGSGTVLTFTVTQGSDTGQHLLNAEIASTSPNGTGFTLSPGVDNLTSTHGSDPLLFTVALTPDAGGNTSLRRRRAANDEKHDFDLAQAANQ